MRSGREILNVAFDLHKQGKWPEAEGIYDRLLGYATEPDANVLYAMGLLRLQQGAEGQAKDYLERAVKEFPDHPAAWTNLGIALKRLGRDLPAIYCHEKACEISPELPEVWSNHAAMYVNAGNPKRAQELALRALALSPEYPEGHNHLALALLEQGHYEEAWPHYEYRWDVPERIQYRRDYKVPKWQGQYVDRLAIHAEQAIGDEIMFMGCFNMLRGRVGSIVVECMDRLVPWFQQSFGVPCYPAHDDLILKEGEPDAYISMGSLARFTGMPSGEPYLAPPNTRMIPGRIGLAWKGGVDKTNQRERSQRLKDLKPLLDLPFDWVSVQYDGEKEAEEAGLPHNIDGRSLEDTRREIYQCELIITPCQTAVHVAGAMGVPCWVMTPWKHAWRYAGAGEQMAWYNSVRLFRQGPDEKWEPVLERIMGALRERE